MSDIKLLELLAKEYPNVESANEEIINLSAILALPKGTEYFLSDLHGEHEAFVHMMKSASGTIKVKIDEEFSELSSEERDALAALVYNAPAEIKRRKESEDDFNRWAMDAIFRLIIICKAVSTKYTRSRVRRNMPKYSAYIMDELLYADDEDNRLDYYREILKSIVDREMAETFIIELSEVIGRLACDHLYIIGDIWDRGARPDEIMDYLMTVPNVDIQWGNHDIVWMGAATGNWACITNVIRMNVSYNNFDMLELGYGINLRPLAVFAEKYYGDDPCTRFMPHVIDENKYAPIDNMLAAKMHKAIAICQFKIEGQRIMAHPEYKMEHRLILDKINWDEGTVEIDGKTWELSDLNFPTVDPDNPYAFTEEEEILLNTLEASFLQSERLQKHIKFMFSHGSLYKVTNGNLLYHGCIPMNEDGSFTYVAINGEVFKGKALMDYFDDQVRKAYFAPDESEEIGRSGDLMWYLWNGANSPLFGKGKMTTFERLFIDDKASHKEPTCLYYQLIKERKNCENILREFGLNPDISKILNGHVPVKIKNGESPIKGDGMLFVIDGGISKAYQKQTGIAGYTFIFNSRFMALVEHKPYSPMKEDGTQEFHSPDIQKVVDLPRRLLIEDTDNGKLLKERRQLLMDLVVAFKKGWIKETY